MSQKKCRRLLTHVLSPGIATACQQPTVHTLVHCLLRGLVYGFLQFQVRQHTSTTTLASISACCADGYASLSQKRTGFVHVAMAGWIVLGITPRRAVEGVTARAAITSAATRLSTLLKLPGCILSSRGQACFHSDQSLAQFTRKAVLPSRTTTIPATAVRLTFTFLAGSLAPQPRGILPSPLACVPSVWSMRSRIASASLPNTKCSIKDTRALCQAEGFSFHPMIMEATGGGWGRSARCVWSKLAKSSAYAAGELATESACAVQFLQRLSMILHRENARACLKRFAY